MQSLYDEIHSLLVKEYFRSESQFAQPSASLSALTITFTDNKLNAMQLEFLFEGCSEETNANCMCAQISVLREQLQDENTKACSQKTRLMIF